jgi:hypothetical protein
VFSNVPSRSKATALGRHPDNGAAPATACSTSTPTRILLDHIATGHPEHDDFARQLNPSRNRSTPHRIDNGTHDDHSKEDTNTRNTDDSTPHVAGEPPEEALAQADTS